MEGSGGDWLFKVIRVIRECRAAARARSAPRLECSFAVAATLLRSASLLSVGL